MYYNNESTSQAFALSSPLRLALDRGFIYDLDRCIDGQSNADEGFYSDSVESSDITYKYPNVNIGNVLIIPMIDMRAILVEWLNFAYA